MSIQSRIRRPAASGREDDSAPRSRFGAFRRHAGRCCFVASLALLILHPAPAASAPLERPVAAFTSSQIWDGDNGQTIARLGLPQQAIFLFRPSSRHPSVLRVRHECCLGQAELAAGADLVAYSWFRGDQPSIGTEAARWGVFLVDTSGREVAAFPGARQFRWSLDGERLAVLYAQRDANWSWTTDSIGIWQRSDGSRDVSPYHPTDMQWGDRGTLYLSYPDRVDAFELSADRVTTTTHGGSDVAPDGLYSMRHAISARVRLFEDARELDLTHCALYRHGYDSGAGFEPFWVRKAEARHLVCLTTGESHPTPPKQSGWRTGLFDPRTLEMVESFPGKAVGPARDQRGVVVVRGDTLALVPLNPPKKAAASDRTVRAKVEVKSWGRRIEPIGIWFHDVAEGDWLPDHTGIHGACDKFFSRLLKKGP